MRNKKLLKEAARPFVGSGRLKEEEGNRDYQRVLNFL